MAVGAIRAVEDRGWRPGRDLSIVGFDDSPIASVLRPSLSSVRQPIVAVAVELVTTLLAELSDDDRRPSRILLAPRLVVRDSSGAQHAPTELRSLDELSVERALATPPPRQKFSANA